MAEQKKPAAGKASAATRTAKTGQTAAATTKTKTAERKSVTATAEPKRTKAATVKAVSTIGKATVPAAEKGSPPGKAAPKKAQTRPGPTPEERYCMVQTAAYFIAERNGFQGYPADHWLQAELEIAAQLGR